MATAFDNFLVGSADLSYKRLRKTLGAIEYEKGVTWSLSAYHTPVNSQLHTLVNANFDYGMLMPVDHSSLWIRTSLGSSLGSRGDPFVNFYVGGVGNYRVDHGVGNRDREYYSLPCFALTALLGSNYG